MTSITCFRPILHHQPPNSCCNLDNIYLSTKAINSTQKRQSRHTHWAGNQNNIDERNIPQMPGGYSFRPILHHQPLKFSLDGDFKINGKLDVATRQRKLIETLTHMAFSNSNYSVSHNPGKRQRLYVIDWYDSNGDSIERLPTIIKNVMKAISSSSS